MQVQGLMQVVNFLSLTELSHFLAEVRFTNNNSYIPVLAKSFRRFPIAQLLFMALVLLGGETAERTKAPPPDHTPFDAAKDGDETQRAKDHSSDNALLDAAKGGDATQKAKDRSSDNALLDAIKNGDETLVRDLLQLGNVSLRTENSTGQTALHLAVYVDSRSIVSLLLDKGADTEAAQSDGQKPLYTAAALGRQPIIELLVEYNANIEALKLNSRTTALHAAVEYGHIEATEFLLKHGANVDSRDLAGNTPLCIAVRRGRGQDLKLAELLLQYGANKKTRLPLGGRTVEDLAAGDNAMIDVLNTVPLIEGPPILPSRANQKLSVPIIEGDVNILNACLGFEATIVDFYIGDRERRVQVSSSVYELLYGQGPKGIMSSEHQTKMAGKQPDFRWYHLPANNVRCPLVTDVKNLTF